VSVHVADLDTQRTVLAGDDHVPLPIAGLGFVPVLVETAAALDAGTMDPLQIVDRSDDELVAGSGLWRNLRAPALPMIDLAVLAAATGDPNAANALLDAVGHDQVRARMVSLGMPRSAVLDHFRDKRGPDDAPHVAVGTTREFATLFAALVNSSVVDAGVSAQVWEWRVRNSRPPRGCCGVGPICTVARPVGNRGDARCVDHRRGQQVRVQSRATATPAIR